MAGMAKVKIPDKLATAYLVTCDPTRQRYAGCTTGQLDKRWRAHVHDSRNGSPKALHAAIREHGEGAFAIRSVYVGSLATALQVERDLIERHDLQSPDLGFNRTAGGEWTEHSDATLRKMSEASRGKPGPNPGVPRPPEVRERIAASLRGRKLSDEHKAKLGVALRKAHAARPAAKEAERRAKISKAHKGRPDGLTPEGRERVNEVLRSPEHRAQSAARMSAMRANETPEQAASRQAKIAKTRNIVPDSIVRDAVRRAAAGESLRSIRDDIRAAGYSCSDAAVSLWSRGKNRTAAKRAHEELQAKYFEKARQA